MADGVNTKAEVIERIEKSAGTQLGSAIEVSHPLQFRLNELIAGARGDVAINLYGDDLGKVSAAAADIAAIL